MLLARSTAAILVMRWDRRLRFFTAEIQPFSRPRSPQSPGRYTFRPHRLNKSHPDRLCRPIQTPILRKPLRNRDFKFRTRPEVRLCLSRASVVAGMTVLKPRSHHYSGIREVTSDRPRPTSVCEGSRTDPLEEEAKNPLAAAFSVAAAFCAQIHCELAPWAVVGGAANGHVTLFFAEHFQLQRDQLQRD